MAEVVALAVSVITIVEIANRIAGACKSYIDSVQDYPKDLRLIYVETVSLKVILESLYFLNQNDPDDAATVEALRSHNGPIEGCKSAMQEMSELLPCGSSQRSRKRSRRQKLEISVTTLAWPLKAEKARRLLNEITHYKATISMALVGGLLWVLLITLPPVLCDAV